MPHIVVLVKHVPDSWSPRTLEDDYTLDRTTVDEVVDEVDERAIECALRIREADPDAGWTITALTIGTERAQAALRKAISIGCDRGVIVTDDALAGSDVLGTAWALTNAIDHIGGADLIVCGNASNDGKTGALPGILSEYRQCPALTNMKSVTIDGATSTVSGTRETEDGDYTIHAAIPAIVSVTEQFHKARFANFKGVMAAKKAKLEELTIADIGVDCSTVGLANAATAVTAATQRPERTRGEIVIDHDGDSAQAVYDFLKNRGLV